MPRILVLIPAYNEEGKIAEVIGRVRSVVPEYDILVVNDGSRDRTAREAAAAGAAVDVIVNTRGEVERSKGVKASLVHKVMAHGKVLYG